MTVPNTYRWQQDRIQKRLEIIEAALQDLDQRKVHFKMVTYLAKYIADAISAIERREIESTNKIGLKVSQQKSCKASSLLKNKTYRSRLDYWISRNNHQAAQDSTEISELRFKLLKLSNEHAVTLDELRSLQEISSAKTNRPLLTTERNDGMTIAHMVISHFKEFCELHDGSLVEPSPGRPTIVPANLFSAYLKWANSLY
jgi:hypothetical protein